MDMNFDTFDILNAGCLIENLLLCGRGHVKTDSPKFIHSMESATTFINVSNVYCYYFKKSLETPYM